MPNLTRLPAAIVLGALGAATWPLFPQSGPPAFEVASVKAIQETRTWALRQVNPERYRSVTNVMQLVTWAWKVKNYQVPGTPAWLSQDRFEIQATTGRQASVDEERLMVQRLLAERFRMKVHRESREIPVYTLIVGKSGPKLAAAGEAANAKGTGRGTNVAPGVLFGRDATMDELVGVLTDNLERPVLDRTGLTGHYDFDVTWEPPSLPANGPQWTPIGEAIFTPIRDLGLRLEAQKASVEMLVIDSIEHPSAN